MRDGPLRESVKRGLALVASSLLAGVAGCTGAGLDDEARLSLASPDGRVRIEVIEGNARAAAGAGDSPSLHYRVERDGTEVLRRSPLGIVCEDRRFVSDLVVTGEQDREAVESYSMPAGKRRERRLVCNEKTLFVENSEGDRVEVVFRACDGGVAFRYRLLGSGAARVIEEASGFALPPGSTGWMQVHDRPTLFTPAHENHYSRVEAGAESPEEGWSFPALFRIGDGPVHVLLTEASLDEPYCAARLHQKPVGGLYRIRFPAEGEGLGFGTVEPEGELPFSTPWRVAVVGDLATVVESTLVEDLSTARDPRLSGNEDWIRPGRAAWSWFSQGTGDEALQREYMDFAAEMGWEYVLVDARWDGWPEFESAVPALVDYAASRGVGIVLWYNSGGPHNAILTETPRGRMHRPEVRRVEMDRLRAWGVRGIKVDFFQSDKPDRIEQYLGILSDALDRRLLVNFHGCTIPRGWARRYPNLMTMEAVRGAENYKMADPPSALDHVRLAHTRNVVGSMDYTPVVFDWALERRGIAYAHQLALSVVFESGWQHFADRADSDPTKGYRRIFALFPFVREFLRAVPAAWDETIYLEGDPDSHVVLARRRGDEWFVAAIHGDAPEAREISLPLAFLGEGSYEMTLIASGGSRDSLALETGVRTGSDRLARPVDPADGFAARFVPRPR